jgi:hypothetical protein
VKGKVSWPIFWASVVVFVVIVCLFSIPAFSDLLRGSELFLTPFAVFFLLGIALLVFTLREKIGGTLKKFFLLTGASATGFFLFVVLHNAFYALGTVSSHIPVLGSLVDFLQVAFFVMAIPVCPLGFLVGMVGSIVLGIKSLRLAKKLASST